LLYIDSTSLHIGKKRVVPSGNKCLQADKLNVQVKKVRSQNGHSAKGWLNKSLHIRISYGFSKTKDKIQDHHHEWTAKP